MIRPEPISTLTNLKRRGINILIHADGGVGKTVLAGTSEKALIIEADDGSDSAASTGSKAHSVPVTGWDDMDEIVEYIRHDVPKMPAATRYRWVWLDGITLFYDLGLSTIMKELVDAKKHRKLWAPDRGEHYHNMNRLQLMVRDLSGLPINFGITAHSSIADDGRYWPIIQGKNMPNKICGYMQVVGHLTVKENSKGEPIRVLYTTMTDDYYAKDRFNALGKIVNPTVPKIQGKIEEKAKLLSQKQQADRKSLPVKAASNDEVL